MVYYWGLLVPVNSNAFDTFWYRRIAFIYRKKLSKKRQIGAFVAPNSHMIAGKRIKSLRRL